MKNLVIFKTHILNKKVVEEFYKLKKTDGIDCIICLDNEDKILKNEKVIEKIRFNTLEPFETDVLCMDLNLLKEFELPFYDNTLKPDYKHIMWYNTDYIFYVVEHFYPDYDYYWTIDCDVYSHAGDYSEFFKIYNSKKSDALLQNFSISLMYWSGTKGTDWVYKGKDIYSAFLPVVRLSKKAVIYLKKRRYEQAEIFEKLEDKTNKNRWVFSEAFIPTECVHKKLSVSGIFEENIKIGPPFKMNSFKKININGKLYHPLQERLKLKRKVKFNKV